MITATEVYEEIVKSTEKIDKSKTQRFPEAASDGDYFRQGDIYINKRDSLSNLKINPKPELQLVPGNTKGSRHCLSSLEGVTIYQPVDTSPLTGVVIENTKEVTITHPEHGDCVLPPGLYEITYQRTMAEEIRRVKD